MNDYPRWADFAKPMVIAVVVDKPGNTNGEGLVRRVKYLLPLGFRGESIETVHNIISGTGYTYTTRKGTEGVLRLEELSEKTTRLHFIEELRLNPPFSWFEGYIQKFMAKYNRKTMLNMSHWLDEHPDY